MAATPVRIVTDSTCDLPPAVCADLGVTVIPLNVRFGDAVYRDQIDLNTESFFNLLAESPTLPTTSQPAPGLFEEAYRRLVDDGGAIVSIHLSAKLSGTVHSAEVARDALGGRGAIEVIDSGSASLGLGLIVVAAAEFARTGADQAAVIALVRQLIPRVHLLFFIDTLVYLQRGGRIGRAQAFLGTLLNIRPILRLEEGEVRPVERARTRSKAMERLVEFIGQQPTIDGLAIVHHNYENDVEALRGRLDRFYPRDKILVGTYGPVIGTHAGPNGLGVIVVQGIAR